jgi:NADH-ubiquinone oxidoreductase chain 2
LYLYVYKKTNNDEIIETQDSDIKYYNKLKKATPIWKERNNSPIQLINQMKGYFHINPLLSLSLAITLFSFAGVPPLIGFFAKLMVLSASIDNGYIFMSIVAILTSVIGGVYYLAIIKQIFFEKSDYILNPNLNNLNLTGFYKNNNHLYNINYNVNNIVLSGSLTIIISIFTSIILLFIFMPAQILNVTSIISMIIFNY